MGSSDKIAGMTDTTRQLVFIQEQIQGARERIRYLEEERAGLMTQVDGPLRDIARLLHARECQVNHTDMCAWEYEEDWIKNPTSQNGALAKGVWTDISRSHNRWLRTALERVAKSKVDAEEYLAALKIVSVE